MPKGISDPRLFEERFWSRIDRSGGSDACWPWRNPQPRGYTEVMHNGVRYRVHRMAWILTFGPIPEGLLACHRCDNPPCCNPRHLFLGTQADNIRDMVAKGRQARSPLRPYCRRGHAYTHENTYWRPDGKGRDCRACKRRIRRLRRRAT